MPKTSTPARLWSETGLTEVSPTPNRAAQVKGSSKRTLVRLGLLGVVAVVFAAAVLFWNNPAPFGSLGYMLALEMRLVSVATIAVVASAQAAGTVLFHTVTGNRILTPSIMGFEAIYVVMQTALVFFFGGAMLAATDGVLKIVVQSLLMIGFSTMLFRWLFSTRRGNLHVMLLVGVVLGIGFGSLATFMQRLLTPSDFDLLSARLFGNLSNSNPGYLPYAGVFVATLLAVAWHRRRKLDVLSLGPDISTNLGLNYKREVTQVLIIISALMSISTALVGPLAFLGFIIATLTYQLAGSTKHSVTIPFSIVFGMAALFVGYFILRHVFYAAGMLSVIIEFIGGITFLIVLLRKGSI